jgi:hypothetical protein
MKNPIQRTADFATRTTQRKVLSILALLLLISAISLTIFQTQKQHPRVEGVVGQYEKFELSYPYSGNFSNPNDPNIVDVEAKFTSPGGMLSTLPGFYFQDYTRRGNIAKEILTPVGNPRWMVRFAPSEIGTYSYTVTLKDLSVNPPTTNTLDSGTFRVIPSSNPGFIRAVGYHFVHENGQPFIPIGVNAPWFHRGRGVGPDGAWGDGTYGADKMFEQFVQNGVNSFHLWTCTWPDGAAAPIGKPNIGCNASDKPLTTMDQQGSWDLDYIVDQAHLDNIYLMPVLKNKDKGNWDSGDLIKSRYFVARWGYSANIMGWDFNKEGAGNPATEKKWTTYMSSIDPYHHLRTTSEPDHWPTLGQKTSDIYDQIFSDPLMTLVQTHDYTGDCPDDLSVNPFDSTDPGFSLFYMKLDPSGNDPRDFHRFNKPSFFGETGVTPPLIKNGECITRKPTTASPLYNTDHKGLILKSELWGSLMGTSGAFAPWYFKFDTQNDWTQFIAFKGISAYASALPLIPDSADLFTSDNDSSQVVVSDPNLRVIGRKNQTFAMLYVQNTTGTALKILQGHTPTPVTGTVTLKGMQAGTSLMIDWFDTDAGNVIRNESAVVDDTGALRLTLPTSITQSIAVIVAS